MNYSTIPSNRSLTSADFVSRSSVNGAFDREADPFLSGIRIFPFESRPDVNAGISLRKILFVNRPLAGEMIPRGDMLRGWANYHRHVVASEAFSSIDTYVFDQLRRMLRRRHPTKSVQWLIQHYWSAAGKNVFAFTAKTAKAGKKIYQVVRVCATEIRRYVKIKAAANPYLPEYAGYFGRRRNQKESKLLPAMSAREYRAMATS